LPFFTSEPNARNNQITRYIRIVIWIIALNWLASGWHSPKWDETNKKKKSTLFFFIIS
jgi:hypothetical protein